MAMVLFTIVAPVRLPSLTVPRMVSPNSQSTRLGPSTTEYTPSPPIHPSLPANFLCHSGAVSALRTVGTAGPDGAPRPSDLGVSTTTHSTTRAGQFRARACFAIGPCPFPFRDASALGFG